MISTAPLLSSRCAGVLLHPTSLPGGPGNGDLGPDAFRFIDFLQSAGMAVWQILPHGPTHEDLSPYQCLSIHAGNPHWISIVPILESGWLESSECDAFTQHLPAEQWREACLQKARQGFVARASEVDRRAYQVFVTDHAAWLEDFALYTALRHENNQQSWSQWPNALRARERSAIAQAKTRLADTIEQSRFEQFLFFRQWHALKQYANERGVEIFGDLSNYVAYDSADVWACREQFDLEADGQPKTVAGVPPDYFSTTGQLWGNPHYHWQHMQADGFLWWRQRLHTSLELFDLVRIDHFRGFESYWAIPRNAKTAAMGRWVRAPGEQLLKALCDEFGMLPVVAEDLGIITPEVEALRHQFGIPGMRVLQFAFDSGPDNPHLPHNHECMSVVYTGTHDNDTTLGWHDDLPAKEKKRVQEYFFHTQEVMPWPMVRAAMASVANMAILPMQDILELGAEGRMNTPSTSSGNWRWRFEWSQLPEGLAGRLHHLAQLYNRSQHPKPLESVAG